MLRTMRELKDRCSFHLQHLNDSPTLLNKAPVLVEAIKEIGTVQVRTWEL